MAVDLPLACRDMMWRLCMCSDEIYANSIFKETHFISMASILDQASPDLKAKGRPLVHTLFGLSKDWWVASARTETLHEVTITAVRSSPLQYQAQVTPPGQRHACS